jgi:hypothetical protein
VQKKDSTQVKKLNYKDVVATQEASGVFTSKVLELTDTKTLKEYMSLNKNLEKVISSMNLSEENTSSVWYTLIGLKQLRENFDKDKDVWNLIENNMIEIKAL